MLKRRQVRKLLIEALGGASENMFRATALLRSDSNQNITDILDQLRAICDITIVNLPEPSKKLSKYVDMSKLNIKFLFTTPSIKQEVKQLVASANSVSGVFSFRIKHIEKIEK